MSRNINDVNDLTFDRVPIMKHPKKQMPMSMKVKIIYTWLFTLFVICGIGIWVFTIHIILGTCIVACAGIGELFWIIYVLKNWKCPHCGHDMPGIHYCKYCGKNLDEENLD